MDQDDCQPKEPNRWKLHSFHLEQIQAILGEAKAKLTGVDDIRIELYPYPGSRWETIVRATKYTSSGHSMESWNIEPKSAERLSMAVRLSLLTARVNQVPYQSVTLHAHTTGRRCPEKGCVTQGFNPDGEPMYPEPPPEGVAYAASPKPAEDYPELTSFSPADVTLTRNEADVLRGKAQQYDEIRKASRADVPRFLVDLRKLIQNEILLSLSERTAQQDSSRCTHCEDH